MAYATGGQRQQRLRAQGHELQRSSDDCSDGRLADSDGEQRQQGLQPIQGRISERAGSDSQPFSVGDSDREGREKHRGLGDLHLWEQDGKNPNRLDINAGISRNQPEGQPRHGDHRDKPGREGLGERREPGFWNDFAITPCRDGKSRRIESGTFPLVDGLPRGVVHSSDPSAPINAKATAEARVMRLRGYGNAIVPELAAEFIRAAMEAIG